MTRRVRRDHDPAKPDDEHRTERGIVLAWCALFMVVLFAFAGFAIDIAFWYVTAGRLQKGADAATLAGVSHLPGSPTQAFDIARDFAKRNGYEDSGNTTVTVQVEPNPSQLRVTITTEVNTFFARLVGYNKQRITRHAIAEFEGPVAMGSPINGLGNEPLADGEAEWTPSSSNPPQFWLNVAGPGTPKINGDRHQAGVCAVGVSGCTGSNNDDYSAFGYSFVVRVGANADFNRQLAIEVFDPAFVEVGDSCTSASLNGAAALDPSTPSRYETGTGRYCTGDTLVNGTAGQGPTTSFLVRAPDNTPWIETDNPVIDPLSVQIDQPSSASGCGPHQYQPYDGDIASKLQSDVNFAGYFRRWVRICTLPVAGPGDYLVQVRTNSPLNNPEMYDPSINTKGHNRFALRAAMVDGSGNPDMVGVSTFASGRLPVYANAKGADTKFALARVMPASADRVMELDFFDTGDASAAGTIRVLPPAETGGSFTDCVFQRDGAAPYTSPDCSLSGVSSANGYNGKTVNARVVLPSNYSCDTSSTTGCWVRLQFQYPSGTSVFDTTTWSAKIVGDPIRLVE